MRWFISGLSTDRNSTVVTACFFFVQVQLQWCAHNPCRPLMIHPGWRGTEGQPRLSGHFLAHQRSHICVKEFPALPTTHVTAFWWCRRRSLKSICIIQPLASTFNKGVWCWVTDRLPDSGHIKKPGFPLFKVQMKGFILRRELRLKLVIHVWWGVNGLRLNF